MKAWDIISIMWNLKSINEQQQQQKTETDS